MQFTEEDLERCDMALGHLRAARRLLDAVKARKASTKVRRALQSAHQATQHVRRSYFRDQARIRLTPLGEQLLASLAAA